MSGPGRTRVSECLCVRVCPCVCGGGGNAEMFQVWLTTQLCEPLFLPPSCCGSEPIRAKSSEHIVAGRKIGVRVGSGQPHRS